MRADLALSAFYKSQENNEEMKDQSITCKSGNRLFISSRCGGGNQVSFAAYVTTQRSPIELVNSGRDVFGLAK